MLSSSKQTALSFHGGKLPLINPQVLHFEMYLGFGVYLELHHT